MGEMLMKMEVGLSWRTAVYLRFAMARKNFKYHLWRGVGYDAFLLMHSNGDSSQVSLRNRIADIIRKRRFTMRGVRELKVITCHSSSFKYGNIDGITVYSLLNTEKIIWGHVEGRTLIMETED